MSDPLTLGLASTAVSLVNGTIGLLKEAREAAKRSNDHDLKDKLSDVADSVLELKEVVGNLRDENSELRKRLQAKGTLKWNANSKLYFAEGDPDPFCPACFDGTDRPIRLYPLTNYDTGAVFRYDCKTCNASYDVNERRFMR
jgi:hypothetical protein